MRKVKDITAVVGMPTYIDDGSDVQPETNDYFLIAKNGFFKVHKTEEIDTIVKLEKLPGPLPEQNSNAVVKWTGPKLPVEDFWFVARLFRKIFKKIKTEFDVQLYYSNKEKKFFIRLPHQKVTGASVDWQLREDDIWYKDQHKIEDNSTLPDDLRHIGRMHSHNVMGAFWSGTDENDQKTQEYGIQIVLGKIMTDLEYKCRVVFNGNLIDVKFEDIVEGELDTDPDIEFPEGIFLQPAVATTTAGTNYYPKKTSANSQVKYYGPEYYKNLKKNKKKEKYSGQTVYGSDYWSRYDDYGYQYGDDYEDPFTREDVDSTPVTASSNIDLPPTGIEKFLTYPDVDMFDDPELKDGLAAVIKDTKIITDKEYLVKDIDFSWLLATEENMFKQGISPDQPLAKQLNVLLTLAMFISYSRDDIPEADLSVATNVLFSDIYIEYSASINSYKVLSEGTKVSEYVDACFVVSVIHKLTLVVAYLTKRLGTTKNKNVEKVLLALTSNNGTIINNMNVIEFIDTMDDISKITRIPAFLFSTCADCDLAGNLADIILGSELK